ncbi:MAG: hypothetical protein ACREIO_09190 [Nitrospiraceae bacterium]
MRTKWAVLLCLWMVLWGAAPVQGTTGDVSGVIEGFMAKQFPDARSHFWIVNATQWQAEDEMVVDLNTVVMSLFSLSPTEKRYLLLIVGGKLAAAQNIPLDGTVNCQPEEA